MRIKGNSVSIKQRYEAISRRKNVKPRPAPEQHGINPWGPFNILTLPHAWSADFSNHLSIANMSNPNDQNSASNESTAGTLKIIGKVIDASTKQSMIGVNIVLKGDRFNLKGTSSGLDGQFDIKVKGQQFREDCLVEVSFVGYKTKLIPLDELMDSEVIELQQGKENNLSADWF